MHRDQIHIPVITVAFIQSSQRYKNVAYCSVVLYRACNIVQTFVVVLAVALCGQFLSVGRGNANRYGISYRYRRRLYLHRVALLFQSPAYIQRPKYIQYQTFYFVLQIILHKYKLRWQVIGQFGIITFQSFK